MANYVQLGQGLRDLGQSLSAGYDFINTQRQLGISQQNADTSAGYLKLQQDQQAEEMRLQRNRESTGRLVSVFQDAVKSGATSMDEYFTKNQAALDTVVNSYATSNSVAREAAGGKRLTGRRTADGVFDIHVVNADGTSAPLNVGGQPMRVTGDDVYRLGLTEMAANGRFEVISGLKALEANKSTMPAEQYQSQRQSYIERLDKIQDAAEQNGIDTAAIEANSDAAGERHAALDGRFPAPATATAPAAAAVPTPPALLARPSPKGQAPSLGDANVSRFFGPDAGAGTAQDAPPATAQTDMTTLPIEQQRMAAMTQAWAGPSSQNSTLADTNAPVAAKLGAYVGKIGKTAIAAVQPDLNAVKDSVAASVAAVGDFANGALGTYSTEASTPQAATPTFSPEAVDSFIRRESKQPDQTPEQVVNKVRQQLTESPPRSETHVQTLVKRGVSSLSAPPKQDSAGTGARDAYVYSMGMIGMGLQPNADVMGNLMAGDTFNGYNQVKRGQDIDIWKEQNANARWEAAQELQFAQLGASRYSTDARRDANTLKALNYELKIRQQTLAERKENIINASKPYAFGEGREYDNSLQKFSGHLTTALAMSAGDAAKQGYNMNSYLTKLTTEPAFVGIMAKWLDRDMKAAKHNAGFNFWDKYRVAPTDVMLKVNAMRDPQGAENSYVQAAVNDAIDSYIQQNQREPDRAFVAEEMSKAQADFAERMNKVDAAKLDLRYSYD